MKFLILLLSLLAATAIGFEIRQPVKVSYEEFVSNVRDQMSCGFSELNIPRLAPLVLPEHYLKYESESLSVEFTVKDFVLNGLDNFDINDITVNPIKSQALFDVVWNNVNLTTWYKIKVTSTSGITINFEREGNAALAIKGFRVVGNSTYKLGLGGGNFSLTTLYIYLTIAEVNSNIENLSPKPYMNKVLNEIIEEWILIAINDYTEEIAELINNFVPPLVNDFIANRPFADVIAAYADDKQIRDFKSECKTTISV